MATIQKRGDSYSIRVSCGYDSTGKQVIQSMTWKPEPKMTQKQIEKELNRQAVMFEEACNHGFQSKAIKFEVFAECKCQYKNEGKIKNKHVGKPTILFFIKHEKSEFVRRRNQELVFHSVRRAINIENMAVMKETVK